MNRYALCVCVCVCVRTRVLCVRVCLWRGHNNKTIGRCAKGIVEPNGEIHLLQGEPSALFHIIQYPHSPLDGGSPGRPGREDIRGGGNGPFRPGSLKPERRGGWGKSDVRLSSRKLTPVRVVMPGACTKDGSRKVDLPSSVLGLQTRTVSRYEDPFG